MMMVTTVMIMMEWKLQRPVEQPEFRYFKWTDARNCLMHWLAGVMNDWVTGIDGKIDDDHDDGGDDADEDGGDCGDVDEGGGGDGCDISCQTS